jgi:hypothetical protein
LVVVSGIDVVTTAEVCGRFCTEFASASLSLGWDASLKESVHDHDPPELDNVSSFTAVTTGVWVVAWVVEVWKLSGFPITKPSIFIVDRLVVLSVVDAVVVLTVVVAVVVVRFVVVVLRLEMKGL